jgi:hypothetical protein
LAEKRKNKRLELLKITDGKLAVIQNATRRARNPYRGKAEIGRRVQREAGKSLRSSEEIRDPPVKFG